MSRNNGPLAYGVAMTNVSAIKDRHLRILVVDDEPRFRTALSSNLSEVYEAVVTDVDSGFDAIQRLKAGEVFDVIFLDLKMPEISGPETYRELKKIDSHCSIVLMSSSQDSDEWLAASKLDGELLSKPSMEQKLSRVLSRVANR
jgi:CheY-like chemotaxis protein